MEMPPYGMIANENVSALPKELWQSFDEQEGIKVGLAHELVHQFVYVPIEFTDPFWSLGVEGFASYFHLPVLAELMGEEFYEKRLAAVERTYLSKREAGTAEGARNLPPEKPLLGISSSEVGAYKDTFVLSDRALLFLNFLRTEMGPERFVDFTRDLFSRDRLDLDSFRQIVGRYLPDTEESLRTWLQTTDYPPEFRLEALRAGESPAVSHPVPGA